VSEAGEVAVARSYTRARRHPWVLGKVGEWVLPLGPYTPAQLVVAGVGVLALIKTYGLWAPVLGPVPVAALGVAVWAVRSARIGGRVPAAALWGVTAALAQPRAGRIGGRAARDRARVDVLGGFYVTATDGGAGRPLRGEAWRGARSGAALVRAAGRAPAGAPVAQTVLQRLLEKRSLGLVDAVEEER
jgi:hypothetical protein